MDSSSEHQSKMYFELLGDISLGRKNCNAKQNGYELCLILFQCCWWKYHCQFCGCGCDSCKSDVAGLLWQKKRRPAINPALPPLSFDLGVLQDLRVHWSGDDIILQAIRTVGMPAGYTNCGDALFSIWRAVPGCCLRSPGAPMARHFADVS